MPATRPRFVSLLAALQLTALALAASLQPSAAAGSAAPAGAPASEPASASEPAPTPGPASAPAPSPASAPASAPARTQLQAHPPTPGTAESVAPAAAAEPAAPAQTQPVAEPTTPAAPGRSAIPYRTEPSSLLEQSLGSLLLTACVLAVAGAGLLLLRARLARTGKLGPATQALQLGQRLRLNPRLDVYVLDYRGHEFLLAQSGDRLLQLRLRPALAGAASAPEAPADPAAPASGSGSGSQFGKDAT